MRVLFTTLPAFGHFHPLVPLAKALQQAGHEVAFAAAPSFQKTVEDSRFPSFPAGTDWQQMMGNSSPADIEKRMGEMRRMAPEDSIKMVANMFIGGFAHSLVPELMSVAETWRPDLLVRGSFDFATCVVGERLGIPCASIQVGGNKPAQMSGAAVTASLDALRASVGLAPDPGQEMVYRDLHLSLMPSGYFGEGALPKTTHFLRPTTFDQSGSEVLPGWAAKLGGRPVVYVTMGTVVNRIFHILASIVAGLRDEPLDLVVTVGRDQDPARLGPQPANVHVERYIPNSLLLPHCDLAVMHGGYSSVMSALIQGVPLVLVPVFADQPVNAQACVEMGAGLLVSPDELTPELLRSRVREGLENPSYRAAAKRFQTETQGLPPLEHGVELLEKLAARPRAARA